MQRGGLAATPVKIASLDAALATAIAVWLLLDREIMIQPLRSHAGALRVYAPGPVSGVHQRNLPSTLRSSMHKALVVIRSHMFRPVYCIHKDMVMAE
jgi:hypothetical protein